MRYRREIKRENKIYYLYVNDVLVYESEFIGKINKRWWNIKESLKLANVLNRNHIEPIVNTLGVGRDLVLKCLNYNNPKVYFTEKNRELIKKTIL